MYLVSTWNLYNYHLNSVWCTMIIHNMTFPQVMYKKSYTICLYFVSCHKFQLHWQGQSSLHILFLLRILIDNDFFFLILLQITVTDILKSVCQLRISQSMALMSNPVILSTLYLHYFFIAVLIIDVHMAEDCGHSFLFFSSCKS